RVVETGTTWLTAARTFPVLASELLQAIQKLHNRRSTPSIQVLLKIRGFLLRGALVSITSAQRLIAHTAVVEAILLIGFGSLAERPFRCSPTSKVRSYQVYLTKQIARTV